MLPVDTTASLRSKKLYIPPMAYGSARAFASAFRAIGLDAEPTPPSDHRTRELGARYTSGDECYPAKVTVGVTLSETPLRISLSPRRRRRSFTTRSAMQTHSQTNGDGKAGADHDHIDDR